ncbi:uncharacterized protein [Atheta coriaria]|uniref:uncharacterized protein n=1 Tax=Dalotia coriaria TaxID=877792 RepID=UPI0031F37294
MKPKLALVLLLGLVVAHEVIGRSTSRVARSPAEVLDKKPEVKPEDEPCEFDSPCGWAVYVRASREVDYYVYNCKCKSDELCTKYEDDISTKAFVYKCRPDDTLFNSTSTTSAPSTVVPTSAQ